MKSALVLMPFFIKISFDFFPPAMAPQTMIEVLPLLKDGARHSLLYFFQCLAPYSGLRGQPADFKTRHVCLDHLSPVVYCPVLVFFFFFAKAYLAFCCFSFKKDSLIATRQAYPSFFNSLRIVSSQALVLIN